MGGGRVKTRRVKWSGRAGDTLWGVMGGREIGGKGSGRGSGKKGERLTRAHKQDRRGLAILASARIEY